MKGDFINAVFEFGTAIAGPSDPLSAQERVDLSSGDPYRWHRSLKSYMSRWLAAHRDGAADTWTRLRHRPEVV